MAKENKKTKEQIQQENEIDLKIKEIELKMKQEELAETKRENRRKLEDHKQFLRHQELERLQRIEDRKMAFKLNSIFLKIWAASTLIIDEDKSTPGSEKWVPLYEGPDIIKIRKGILEDFGEIKKTL